MDKPKNNEISISPVNYDGAIAAGICGVLMFLGAQWWVCFVLAIACYSDHKSWKRKKGLPSADINL